MHQPTSISIDQAIADAKATSPLLAATRYKDLTPGELATWTWLTYTHSYAPAVPRQELLLLATEFTLRVPTVPLDTATQEIASIICEAEQKLMNSVPAGSLSFVTHRGWSYVRTEATDTSPGNWLLYAPISLLVIETH